MKKKKLNLNFNKEIVSNLEMNSLKGGYECSRECIKSDTCLQNICLKTKVNCATQAAERSCIASCETNIGCNSNLCPISGDCLPPTCGPCAR